MQKYDKIYRFMEKPTFSFPKKSVILVAKTSSRDEEKTFRE
jgi:hypothetical protein